MAREPNELEDSLLEEESEDKSFTNKLNKLKMQNLKKPDTLGKVIAGIIILIALIIVIWIAVWAIDFGTGIGDGEAGENQYHEPYANFELEPFKVIIGEMDGRSIYIQTRLYLAYDRNNLDLQEGLTRYEPMVYNIINRIFSQSSVDEVVITENREKFLIPKVLNEINRLLVECQGEDYEKFCVDEDELYRQMIADRGEDLLERPTCNCEGVAEEGVKAIYFDNFQFFPIEE